MALAGKSSALYMGTTAADDKVANIISITPPKRTTLKIDATVIESTAKAWIAGILEVGEVEFTAQFGGSDYENFLGVQGVTQFFKIVFTNANNITWSGFLESCQPVGLAVQDIVTCKVTIVVSGDLAFSLT